MRNPETSEAQGRQISLCSDMSGHNLEVYGLALPPTPQLSMASLKCLCCHGASYHGITQVPLLPWGILPRMSSWWPSFVASSHDNFLKV